MVEDLTKDCDLSDLGVRVTTNLSCLFRVAAQIPAANKPLGRVRTRRSVSEIKDIKIRRILHHIYPLCVHIFGYTTQICFIWSPQSISLTY